MRVLVAMISLLALGLVACADRGSSRHLPADQAAELLIDRNWLDRWPSSKDDRLHVYRFTPAMGGGVYQDRTLFRGTFELFQFEATGAEIELHLPDAGERVRTGYLIERVDGPEPFDLRLTLETSPRGPSVYYGRADEGGRALDFGLPPLPL